MSGIERDKKAGCIIACAVIYNQFDEVAAHGMPEAVRKAWIAGKAYTEWVEAKNEKGNTIF